MKKNLEKIKCSDQLLFAKLLFFHLSLGVPHCPRQLGKSPNFCQNSELERRFSLTLGHLCPPKSPGWLVSPPHLVEIVTQLQDVQKKVTNRMLLEPQCTRPITSSLLANCFCGRFLLPQNKIKRS